MVKEDSDFQIDAKIPLNIDPKISTTLTENDLLLVMLDYIDHVGMCGHHIDSINDFYNFGLKSIVRDIFEIVVRMNNPRESEAEKSIKTVEMRFIINDARINPPTYTNTVTNSEELLYPSAAVTQEKIYSGKIFVDGVVQATATHYNGQVDVREESISNFIIGRMPIMVKSNLCNTVGLSREALIELGEDPNSFGGFIPIRNEYSPDSVESIAFNVPKEFINEGYGKQFVRSDFLSKPGDGFQNQDMFKIVLNNDNTFIVQVQRDYMMDVDIPFFLLYQALGCTVDKEIIESIVYDIEDPLNSEILKHVCAAMIANYGDKYHRINNRTDALRKLVDLAPPEAFPYLDLAHHPENYQNAINSMANLIDMRLFPHIGITSATRVKKLRFMGYLLRRTLSVHLRIIPETDRDSAKIKRIHSFGISMSKLFKQMFNRALVVNTKKQMKKAINANPFANIPLASVVRAGVVAEDFERILTQSITNGHKAQLRISQGSGGNKQVVSNRMSSQRLHRKNIPNIINKGRIIIASSVESAKQSDRAIKVRQIHSSCISYICVTSSPPEGVKVGVNREFGAFASIAKAGIMEVLKDQLLEDSDIIPEVDTLSKETISRKKYGFIFINGTLMGYSENNLSLAKKYRKLRREGAIDCYTTIYWDEYTNNLNFFVDIGRLVRPIVIVYNNYRDHEAFGLSAPVELGSPDFMQCTAITPADIQDVRDGKKTIYDLISEQKIEFITPEEQQNILICTSISDLRVSQHDSLKQYTHVEVPQSIIGFTAMTAPFPDHNQQTRNTYQSSMIKQTAGIYIANYAHRIDIDTFIQPRNENPLLQTVTNRFIPPNGINLIVAILCAKGENQEDSTVMNKGSIERGIFNGSKFNRMHIMPDSKDEICTPDVSRVEGGIKTANYSKLVNGIVQVGCRLEKGDVVVGKTTEIQKPGEAKRFKDSSVIYTEKEPALVLHVVFCHNDEGVRTIKIGYQYTRNMDIGDKAATRSGQKGICAGKLNEAYMPFTASGMRPDILFNPHSLPTRMTIAQWYELIISRVAGTRGMHVDGTIFTPIILEYWQKQLVELGMESDGTEVMYDGTTGQQYDVKIYIGPVYYQRLLKLVQDAKYVVTQGMLDATTRQPVEGKSRDGGLRLGEMEKDCFITHGSVLSLSLKFRQHSDGFLVYKCRLCGKTAIVNHQRKLYTCKECKDRGDIYCIKTTWTAMQFAHEAAACGISIRMYPEPHLKYRIGKKEDTQFEKFANLDLEDLSNDAEDTAAVVAEAADE